MDRHTWLQVLMDTPVRPHIYLTIVFTALCLLIPGFRAHYRLMNSAAEVKEQRHRGDIHLDAMTTMNAAVTRFLTLIDDYLASDRGQQLNLDNFDDVRHEVEASTDLYKKRGFLVLNISEMSAISDFDRSWTECLKMLQNDLLPRREEHQGREGPANQIELQTLANDIRQAIAKLSDATSRTVAERNGAAQQEYRSALIAPAAVSFAGLALQAALIFGVVAVRRRKLNRPSYTSRP